MQPPLCEEQKRPVISEDPPAGWTDCADGEHLLAEKDFYFVF